MDGDNEQGEDTIDISGCRLCDGFGLSVRVAGLRQSKEGYFGGHNLRFVRVHLFLCSSLKLGAQVDFTCSEADLLCNAGFFTLSPVVSTKLLREFIGPLEANHPPLGTLSSFGFEP